MKIAIDRYVMLESDLVSSLGLPLYSKGLLTVILLELLQDLISPRPSLPASTVLRAEDDTATGSTETSLASKLHFTRDEHGQEICLLRESNKEVGVMIGLERNISGYKPLDPSRRSAQELLGSLKCCVLVTRKSMKD